MIRKLRAFDLLGRQVSVTHNGRTKFKTL